MRINDNKLESILWFTRISPNLLVFESIKFLTSSKSLKVKHFSEFMRIILIIYK